MSYEQMGKSIPAGLVAGRAVVHSGTGHAYVAGLGALMKLIEWFLVRLGQAFTDMVATAYDGFLRFLRNIWEGINNV